MCATHPTVASVGPYLRAFSLTKAAHGDNLACRLGGEELALILPDTELEPAVGFADKLTRKIEQLPVTFRGQQLGKISASFGVAPVMATANPKSFAQWIRRCTGQRPPAATGSPSRSEPTTPFPF
jgi:diguanylate cyclase (GGDEF)-like protein